MIGSLVKVTTRKVSTLEPEQISKQTLLEYIRESKIVLSIK